MKYYSHLNCRNVGDILTNKSINNTAYIFMDNVHNYVFIIGANHRWAYKVTSTNNDGIVLCDYPMSWARVKKVAHHLLTPYENGNITPYGKEAEVRCEQIDEAMNCFIMELCGMA